MIKWPWKANELKIEKSDAWNDALNIPLLSCLNEDEKLRLIQVASQLLQQKRLVPLQGVELTELMQARIALLFALPVMELALPGSMAFTKSCSTFPFVVDAPWQDENGLVHAGSQIHAGQSWDQGPIVLNWQDIEDSFDNSGFNLIIHEAAHKLDMRNGGEVTGIPPIPLREVVSWEHDLHAAMQNLQDEIDTVGEEAASMDAYAATDAAECFAVLSEYFFSAPELLSERFPLVYGHSAVFINRTRWQGNFAVSAAIVKFRFDGRFSAVKYPFMATLISC